MRIENTAVTAFLDIQRNSIKYDYMVGCKSGIEYYKKFIQIMFRTSQTDIQVKVNDSYSEFQRIEADVP